MKPICITIGGPQSAGKSQAVKFLSRKFKNLKYHQELNPYSIKNKNHLGGAFVGRELEKKIIQTDLERLSLLRKRKTKKIHLIETGLFHLIYSQKLLDSFITEQFEEKYNCLLSSFQTGVFFIDTKPQASWQRRKGRYLNRALREIKRRGLKGSRAEDLKEKMKNKYKKRLFDFYPSYPKLYKKISYPKVKVLNNGQNLTDFEKKVIRAFLKLTQKMNILPSMRAPLDASDKKHREQPGRNYKQVLVK